MWQARDGVLGRNSVAGLQAFQRSKQIIADGFPSPEVFSALGYHYCAVVSHYSQRALAAGLSAF